MSLPKVIINGVEWVPKEWCQGGAYCEECTGKPLPCPCKCHLPLTETHTIEPYVPSAKEAKTKSEDEEREFRADLLDLLLRFASGYSDAFKDRVESLHKKYL